jgi:hypothetical protein
VVGRTTSGAPTGGGSASPRSHLPQVPSHSPDHCHLPATSQGSPHRNPPPLQQPTPHLGRKSGAAAGNFSWDAAKMSSVRFSDVITARVTSASPAAATAAIALLVSVPMSLAEVRIPTVVSAAARAPFPSPAVAAACAQSCCAALHAAVCKGADRPRLHRGWVGGGGLTLAAHTHPQCGGGVLWRAALPCGAPEGGGGRGCGGAPSLLSRGGGGGTRACGCV